MKKHTAPRAPRFDRQWTELINLLPDEDDRKLLTDAIVKYQLDATEPELPPHLAVAFGFIRPTIDRRARARMRRRERLENQRRAGATPQAEVEAPATAPAPTAANAPKRRHAIAKAEKRATKNTTKKSAKKGNRNQFKNIVLTAKRHRDNLRISRGAEIV